MKKIKLIAIGKLKEKYLTDAVAEYLKRLSRFCAIEIVELADFGDRPDAVKRESEGILAKAEGVIILTDLKGDMLSSEQFASALDKAYLKADTVSLIIGGSAGVSDELRGRADKLICFGKMTFPHQLMRVIVLEQVYRAFNILSGTPYHK